MDKKFTIEWILANYTTESWNEMHKKAEKDKPDELTIEYNNLYNNTNDPLNINYNTMYGLVETGSEITDPEMKKDVEDWNNQQLPPIHITDYVSGHTLYLQNHSSVDEDTNRAIVADYEEFVVEHGNVVSLKFAGVNYSLCDYNIPEITAADKGKILTVNSAGQLILA